MNIAVWTPQNPEKTKMWRFMRFVEKHCQQDFTEYQDLHEWSIQNPALFWQALCDFFNVRFTTQPQHILNDYQNMLDARWFEGATLNFTEMLLSRDDDHPAIISIDEENRRQSLSYHELRTQVSFCAEGLKQAGVKTGDRVAAIMPNIPQTIIAMLATASIGAIWASCSPDFGITAAIDRLGQIEPKILFITDGHTYQGKPFNSEEKIQQAQALIPSLSQIVVFPFLDLELNTSALTKVTRWGEFIKPAHALELTRLPFSHPLYILFSSGTTGKPKCIVHGSGGTLLQHIKELGLHTDIQSHDNLCFYTTCGWMMWNWMVSVLALGATLTLYEGSPTYPDATRLFQLLNDENVTVFGTSAKFLSTLEKSQVHPNHHFALTHLRCILSTGSPLLTKNYDYVYQSIKSDVQLCSISGGTDIISCFALGNPILPVYRGELQCIGLGMAVEVFNEQGQAINKECGELVCTKPFPSMPVFFWNDPDKSTYKKAYFERFNQVWAHGDFAEITAHHGLIIYGRSDAVLNPGGVRIGTAEIYRQVEKIDEILDSVVIGQEWQDDVRIVLFVKLREGYELDETLKKKICLTIRSNASPRHVPAKILQVADIPRTINGKIVELAVRQIVHGQDVQNIQSLANPEALDYFKHRDELG